MSLNSIPKSLPIPLLWLFMLCSFQPSHALARETPGHSLSNNGNGHQYAEAESEVKLEEKIGASIPLDLAFFDEEGQQVTLGQLVNGPTLIAPVYYKCSNVCNFLQAGLARVLPSIKRRPGEEYQVVSFSFDETETPELAVSTKDMYYKAMDGAFPEEAWHFLTGDIASIRKLTDAAGYSFRRLQDGHFLHPVVIFVVDSKGTIVRYLHGTHFLPKDIMLALVEASEGRLGTTIQKVVRFCFSYEAENKTYVFNLLRVTGTVVLLTAVFFLTFLVLGGKKRKKGIDHG